MHYDPLTITFAVIAVIAVGLTKGGFSGLGATATPILALAMSPTQAAAILLPVIVVQDAISVWAFRKTWDRWVVAWMLPGGVIGVGLGYLFAARLSLTAVTGALGLITLSFGIYRLWIERGGRIVAASNSPGWVGSLFGIAMGFTSQIAHAGGPVIQMWLTPRKLPHVNFVGTIAVTFAAMNVIKLPAYAALGEFTRENLIASALLTPIAILSTLGGIWLIRRIDTTRFYHLIYGLMILLGSKLLWDALTA